MTVATPVNPSESAPRSEADRIPMSVPTLKLAVPEIPGYYLHWFRDEPGRIAQALRASYEFVSDEEVQMPGGFLGSDTAESRNSDMGSRVSMLAGGTNAKGDAGRLYLMKLKKELRDKDLGLMADQSDKLAKSMLNAQIGADGSGEKGEDRGLRYTRTKKASDLFRRKASKT